MWREGEGSKRRVRMVDWVSEGRVGRVEAGGREVSGRSMVVVVFLVLVGVTMIFRSGVWPWGEGGVL